MKRHIFNGRLRGFICGDCAEPLSHATVRLYRLRHGQDAAALEAANPKQTLAMVDDDEAGAKASSLFAEARTDADGNFSAVLDERYDGDAFEIDVLCTTVPGLDPTRRPKPQQFTITVVRPQWQERDDNIFAVWNHDISYRWWCRLRAGFGAWCICGVVRECRSRRPIAGVKVTALDADWWQDDVLGSAVTDGAGRFRIDYTADDFERTPSSPQINIELTGGPDIYFKIEAGGGQVLLAEPQSRARQPDRENVGHCFCASLCVDLNVGVPLDKPMFMRVGSFHIDNDISASSGLANKVRPGKGGNLTGGPGFGFYSGVELGGYCPTQIGGQPARYRFLYEDLAAPGTLKPITGALLYFLYVGARYISWNPDGTLSVSTFQSTAVNGFGATADPPTQTPDPPPDHVIVSDENGWIKVDQIAHGGGFNGPLIGFDTTQIQPALEAPGDLPGDLPTNPKSGVDLRIVFQAGPVSASPDGPIASTNALAKIHINNWGEVHLLELDELNPSLGGTPCSKVTNEINIQYTVDHELTRTWSIGIANGAGSPPPLPPLPSGTSPRGGAGTQVVDVSTWPPCSYIVTLTTQRRLTDGLVDDPGRHTPRIFCK